MEETVIHYRFKFDDSEIKDYRISLDPETVSYAADNQDRPEWTRLNFHRCENCPLDSTKDPHCPVALNLAVFVDHFKDEISYKEALVLVKANDRFYSKRISLQEGLSSVYGLIMSTSDCPVMNFLKPMARFHLPFSSMEETVFRSVSSYLLEQYFSYKRGKNVDFDLTGLLERYQSVEMVNSGISARLRAVTTGDADRNAVALLDSLAQVMHFEVESSLESLEYLYDTIPENMDIM